MTNPQNRQFIEYESSNVAAMLVQGQTHEAADRLRQDYQQMVRGGQYGNQGLSLEGEKDFRQIVHEAQRKEQDMLLQQQQNGYYSGLHPARIAEERVQVPGNQGYPGQSYQGQQFRTMTDVSVFGPDDRAGYDPRRGAGNIVLDVGLLPEIYGGPMRGPNVGQPGYPYGQPGYPYGQPGYPYGQPQGNYPRQRFHP